MSDALPTPQSVGHPRARDVLVILPLYRNAGLIPDLFRSLIAAADDFRAIGGRLLIIVDSPDDESLIDMLHDQLPALEAVVPVELHINEKNLGFVGSMNFGFDKAIAERRDALALNSDVIVSAGAFKEMQAVAYLDHMTGFVSPRSNNATICSLPNQARYRHRSVDASRASFEILSPYLPRVRYAPTVVGFCLYIKWTMLAEFGTFDPVYGRGYNEENDLILRANQCGYRAVLANHAFVYHIGEQSFSLTQEPMSKSDLLNGTILRERYPEYQRSIVREAASPEALAEVVLTGLLPDSNGRLTVAFDWSNIGLYHNGTFEAAKEILRAAARRWKDLYDIVVIGTPQAAAFHQLHDVADVRLVSPVSAEVFAAIVRVGQPFDAGVIDYLSQHAPVVVLYMLDTIALDCQYLDAPNLQDLWQYSLDSTDVIVYISEYSQAQFRSRFRIPPEAVEVASLLSLDPTDYRQGEVTTAPGDSILVVGNHFAHKHVDATVAALAAAAPQAKIVALGGSNGKLPNVTVHKSGSLSEAQIDQLYCDASVVVFPSHYEGFGLPIMHAIARKRPVIVRTMPLYDEFKSSLRNTANLYQCETTQEMVELAVRPTLRWQDEPSLDNNGQGWDRAAADLEAGVAEALKRVRYDHLVTKFERCRRRERSLSVSQAAAQPPQIKLLNYTVPSSMVLKVGTSVILAALLAALAVMVYSAFIGFRGYSALPYWDQWQYVRPETIVASLFQFHNEHRAIISKLLFWMDAQWFGSRNIMLFAAIYLIQALHCAVLIKMALASGITGRIRLFLVPAVTICALFSTQNYENLTWGFQTQFVLVFAMASASFLAFATFVAGNDRRWLLAAIGAALVASFEMANGAAVWPLLILFALHYRLSSKVLAILMLATAAVGLTYLSGRMQFQTDPTVVKSNVLLVAKYVLVYLGGFLGDLIGSGPIGRALGSSGPQSIIALSMTIGAVLIGCWTGLALVAWRLVRQARPALVAIACVFGFAVASAVATALGRAGFGLETALSARYVAGSSLATVATAFAILWLLSKRGHGVVQMAVLSSMALVLVLIAFAQPRYVAMADNRRIGRDMATTALYAGGADEDALRNAFIATKLVVDEAAYLKAASKSVFADPAHRWLGRRIEGSVADCAVRLDPQPSAAAEAHRVGGSLELNPFLLRRPMVVVTDPQNVVVGFGFASLQNDQTRLVRFNRIKQTIPWQGHVVAGAQGPFQAFVSSGGLGCGAAPN